VGRKAIWRLFNLLTSYSKSPILTHFGWSPLITAALAANARIIHPSLSSLAPSSFSPYSKPKPFSGLLALHVRRGDYVDHCRLLAGWSSHFMGFNEFPGLPDRFYPLTESDQRPLGEGEQQAWYSPHCFPSIDQIVSRVREVRRALLSTTDLTRVYIMSNGRPEWLRELKHALEEDAVRGTMGPWKHITTSRDLRLTREQQHNGQMVDMAIAQRAEVFIGNGVRFVVLFFSATVQELIGSLSGDLRAVFID
jgi:hypothetical protein